jgi:hypothetical protein
MENANENETATFACKLIDMEECHVAHLRPVLGI